MEFWQDADGYFDARIVYSNGLAGPGMRLSAPKGMTALHVQQDLQRWHEGLLVRNLDAGPPEGDDAVLWL